MTSIQQAINALHESVQEVHNSCAFQVHQADREVKAARAAEQEANRTLNDTLTRLALKEAQLERHQRFARQLRHLIRTGPLRGEEIMRLLDLLEAD